MKGAADARAAYADCDLQKNDCYKYAALRNILYRKGKSVEMLIAYEPSFAMMNEWYKQLFGESEGKDNKGIYPLRCILNRPALPRSVHSGRFPRNVRDCYAVRKAPEGVLPQGRPHQR